MGATIPANSPLLFSIEVVDIESDNIKVEADPNAPKFTVTVTEEGTGEPIKAGQKIKAHYRGTMLDGTQFDASYDRGTPLDFTVGKGMVIKCWD